MFRLLTIILLLTLFSCSTKKLTFKNNPDRKCSVCLWLWETDKFIYFNTDDLLTFSNISSRYDSTELMTFHKKIVPIFKQKSDTLWTWYIGGDLYVSKDTTANVNSCFKSDIFDDLLFDLLKNRKANMISGTNSNYLLLKTRYAPFLTAKFKEIYNPDNKEYLVGKEIWRRRVRHDGF